MLQQTTVATVATRFPKFLAAFPDLHALAVADEQDVLHAWEGLGYYERARNLHRAARLLAMQTQTQIPDDPEILGALPGVGPYILGAVLSQAFDRRVPIVEANSKRVLCRLFARQCDPASGPAQKWLWTTAALILPAKRVGDFNQALMELGSQVCKGRSPDCARCPLRSSCQAYQRDLQEVIPIRSNRPAPNVGRQTCVVLRKRARVLLAQRPAAGRWANMWEFPCVELETRESFEAGARRLLASLGVEARLGDELMTIRYVVTRHRMTMRCLEARSAVANPRRWEHQQYRWVRPAELAQFPVSSAQRKLAAAVAAASTDLDS